MALQALYQLDLRGESVLDDVGHLLDEGTAEPSVRLFARQLIDGVREHQAQLDEAISAVAENWDLGRMAVVDRNLLRIGAFELLHLDDVPPKVSINEAVDLAKSYADTQSGAFVNGILDRIRQEHVPEKGQDNGRSAEPTSENESP